MPAYGLIPDSPLFYFGGKLRRGISRSFRNKGLNLRPRNIQVSIQFKKLVVYKPILEFELNHRYGTVGRHLHRTANRITQLAKLQVGKKTGRLMRSIQFEHNYALLHHRGTKPHIITPNKPGGTLVFRSGSKIVRTPIVRHPGTRPNHYLTDPMRTVIRQQRRSLRA